MTTASNGKGHSSMTIGMVRCANAISRQSHLAAMQIQDAEDLV